MANVKIIGKKGYCTIRSSQTQNISLAILVRSIAKMHLENNTQVESVV